MKVLFFTMSLFLMSFNSGFAAKDNGFCLNDKHDPSSKVPGAVVPENAVKKVKGSKALKEAECSAADKAAGKC